MKRWLLLPPLFLAGLFAAFHATAAVKETMVSTSIVPIGSGQYKLTVTQQSPDTMINGFVFVPGSTLTVTSIASVSRPDGSCALSGGNVSCTVTLELAPCTCQPGGSVDVILNGSGDVAGSTLQVNGLTVPVTVFTGVTTTTQTTTAATTTTVTTTTATTTTKTTTTTAKPPAKHKKKVVPKCKKGHKSTKKHHCHK